MKLKTTLFGKTYQFQSIKEVLAKSNEVKAGDRLAGIAAADAAERIAAKVVLADLTVADLRNNPVVSYELDEVTRVIQDAVDEALLVHGGDLTGDAAQGEAAVDILVDHLLAQEAGGGQRCAAGAHLHGEAVVQISGGLDDVGGGLGDAAGAPHHAGAQA